MGNFFSRAFKRLTQCSHSTTRCADEAQQQQDSTQSQQQARNGTSAGERTAFESIPVGQSIESSDYAPIVQSSSADSTQPQQTEGDSPKIEHVEEAVIKIQALVRGHLTRKALKDVHHHSVPPVTTLGQSQFDEDALIRAPISAIIPGRRSPLASIAEVTETAASACANLNAGGNEESASVSGAVVDAVDRRESDSAEAPESTPTNNDKPADTGATDEQRRQAKKFATHCARSASSPSKLEMPAASHTPESMRSASPALSEAGASIDLNCDTPASASIDIQDHNIKPTDKMASVLHHKQPPQPVSINSEELQVQPDDANHQDGDDAGDDDGGVSSLVIANLDNRRGDGDNDQIETSDNVSNQQSGPQQQQQQQAQTAIGTPDSLESEEAAAIRIQSAFRGYRTRKNSPYRTRSPNASTQSKRNALRQQDACGSSNELPVPPVFDHDEEEEILGMAEDNDVDNCGAQRLHNDHPEMSANPADNKGYNACHNIDEDNDNQTYDTTSADTLDQHASRRASRCRQREHDSVSASTLAQRTVSQQADDEPTTTDEEVLTVKEANFGADGEEEGQQQPEADYRGSVDLSALESLKSESELMISENENGDAADQSAEMINSGAAVLATTSDDVSLDTTAGNLTAALDGNQTVSSSELGLLHNSAARPSIGAKSEASIETDSSFIGAALSLNEADNSVSCLESHQSYSSKLPSVSEVERELEVRRLVDEITEDQADECETSHQPADGTESTGMGPALAGSEDEYDDKDVEAVSDDMEAQANLAKLNEEEQRVIELESDDVERRDPFGHATLERAKMSQASMDQAGNKDDEGQPKPLQSLGFPGPEEATKSQVSGSGQSSPGLNSSTTGDDSNASADDDDNNNDDDPEEQEGQQLGAAKQSKPANNHQKQPQQQQQQQSGPASRANKRRNNRNKRKGKK